MKISTCGIDLAKVVFQVHGVDQHGKVCLRKQIKRAEMFMFFAKLDPLCNVAYQAADTSSR